MVSGQLAEGATPAKLLTLVAGSVVEAAAPQAKYLTTVTAGAVVEVNAPAAGPTLVSSATASGTTASWVVNTPAGAVGDLIIIFSTETSSGATPAGFTQLYSTPCAAGQLTSSVYYKIATGTEGSTITSLYGGNTSGWAVAARRYSGVKAVSSINASLFTVSNVAGSSPRSCVAASITTTVANTLLLYSATAGGYGALPGINYGTPTATGLTFTNITKPAAAAAGSIIVAEAPVAAAGATGAVTCAATYTSGTAQGFGAGLVALTPA